MDPIICDGVWKKYSKGEKMNALRDALPFMAGKLFKASPQPKSELKPNEFWVLQDVSFKVKKGEVLGIIGPNGAGKSTILKLLSRIIKPNKGTFSINGRLSALIEITAGFHPDFTGRENVYFNGAILGMTKKEIDNKFEQIVDFSGVREFIDTPVKRYSSGMYARLGFSVAAYVNPDVLLVDEVLAVGDMNFQAKCAEKMRELLHNGTTIILVSHNIPMVQSLCSRVILLNHGQVTNEGTPEEVIPHYQDLVFTQNEEELKKKMQSSESPTHLMEDTQTQINEVQILGQTGQPNENLLAGQAMNIEIHFETKKKVINPVIVVEIIRADGVICCSANTTDSHYILDSIENKGRITVHLGEISLAPGVYHIAVSMWDKEMVHTYATRKKDVFRVESRQLNLQTDAVFLPKVRWERGT